MSECGDTQEEGCGFGIEKALHMWSWLRLSKMVASDRVYAALLTREQERQSVVMCTRLFYINWSPRYILDVVNYFQKVPCIECWKQKK